MVASTVGMDGLNVPLKVEGWNHGGTIAILNNTGNGGFGISFRINGAVVCWLGYETSDRKLHWNSASSGSHVIA